MHVRMQSDLFAHEERETGRGEAREANEGKRRAGVADGAAATWSCHIPRLDGERCTSMDAYILQRV